MPVAPLQRAADPMALVMTRVSFPVGSFASRLYREPCRMTFHLRLIDRSTHQATDVPRRRIRARGKGHSTPARAGPATARWNYWSST
jgi:hypothetical protein